MYVPALDTSEAAGQTVPTPVPAARFHRIAVIGCPGSGKTWLAVELSRITALPHVELDRHFWGPNWTPTDDAFWKSKVEQLAAATSWIIDGNYEGTLAVRLKRCEWVIWMDLGTAQCLWGVFKRMYKWRRSRLEDLPPYVLASGRHRRVSAGFGTFLSFVLSFRRSARPRVIELLNRVVVERRTMAISVVRSRSDAKRLLGVLTKELACPR